MAPASWRSPRLGLAGTLIILALSISGSAQTPEPQQLFREAFEAQQRGDRALAVRKYGEPLQLRPDMFEARANLASALVALGRFDEAIVQYRAALAYAPDNHALHVGLAFAYYRPEW
jgi:tetratricopeptide (TPR) repeat protein